MEKPKNKAEKECVHSHEAWMKVKLSRHPSRPHTLNYINYIFDNFQELHGDRLYKDDPAIVCGMAMLNKTPVSIIGTQKGRGTNDNIKRNFGCPRPEGYRKALRIMKLASKFKLPIISFIDTPGAYPGISSEERHISKAIADNIQHMFSLNVPIISIIIGEGGSGGALGLSVADTVMILENAYYSVISPEGCAAILWKDRNFALDSSSSLNLTARNLKELNVVDKVIPEPVGGSHENFIQSADSIKKFIKRQLKDLVKINTMDLLKRRYNKYRNMGIFIES